jgi:hypothetical protein
MGEVTREELAMTDQELLAYEREHHCDPYMTLVMAKGMQRGHRTHHDPNGTWQTSVTVPRPSHRSGFEQVRPMVAG